MKPSQACGSTASIALILPVVVLVSVLTSCGVPGDATQSLSGPEACEIDAIHLGRIVDSDGNPIHDPALRETIIEYLLVHWHSLESAREAHDEAARVPRRPPGERHLSPTEHFAMWRWDRELFFVERPWEDPPVVSVYKIWVCFFSGCREATAEYVGVIQP